MGVSPFALVDRPASAPTDPPMNVGATSTIRIGISGWNYPHFRGAFYPANVPAHRELAYASRIFNSLESNRSFYSLLSPAIYRSWREQTPHDFVLSLKGGNFITHSKKLRDVQVPLANFFASGPLALGPKLGPIVWQLPERLSFDPARLRGFFELLPKTTAQAARLARHHDQRLRHGAYLKSGRNRRLRHALEPRHESFRDPAFAALAHEYGVAIAIADSATWPCFETVTTDFVYVRLHGHSETYRSMYSGRLLAKWARRIHGWQGEQRDVFVYFDNDFRAHSAHNARQLASMLGSPHGDANRRA